MTQPMTEAVLSGASREELTHTPPPEWTRAVCVRREDERMFVETPDDQVDVRSSLHLLDVPIPDIAADEVLIAVMASAINYNTVWSAAFRPVSTFRFLDRLAAEGPEGKRHARDWHALGSDASGVIVRVGSAVRHWSVGDHVVVSTLHTDEQDPITQSDGMLSKSQRAWGYETNFGGLADYSIAKATQLLPKPAHLTWEEAACNTLCLMTAYRMLISEHGTRVKVGDLVLIWGAAGGLGSYGVQLAKAAGCRVVGVVGGEARVKVARAAGCDLVIDRKELWGDGGGSTLADWRQLGSAIRDRFSEDPHHVFEHVGRPTFSASVYLARRGGTVVTCGSSGGYLHEFDNRYLWMNLKRIIGSHGANYQEAAEANRLVTLGVVVPALSKVYSLDAAAAAAQRVHRNEHVGKVGVMCLAPERVGVTDPEFRATITPQRLQMFRDVSGGDGPPSTTVGMRS